MNILQTIKTVVLKFPTAKVDNASLTYTTALDTAGFHEAKIDVILGDTDIGVTALKLQESNSSDMSSATDVPECDFTGDLPTATDDNKIYSFHVDTRGRKRYLRPVVTIGDGVTGAFADVIAYLAGGSEQPDTATERGLAGERFAKG